MHEEDLLLSLSVDDLPPAFAYADRMDMAEREKRAELELEASCMPRWAFSQIYTHQ